MSWYIEALKKYAVFDGRARRKEYWFFSLFSFIIAIILVIIDGIAGTISQGAGIGLFSGIYQVGVLIPSFAVGIRRLHDTDHSAWWVFIGLIPIIGAIILIIILASDGDSGENRYGSSPKQEQSLEAV